MALFQIYHYNLLHHSALSLFSHNISRRYNSVKIEVNYVIFMRNDIIGIRMFPFYEIKDRIQFVHYMPFPDIKK